jgi:hypothetical protein
MCYENSNDLNCAGRKIPFEGKSLKVCQLFAEKAGLVQALATEGVFQFVIKFPWEKKIVMIVVGSPGGEIVGILSECCFVRGRGVKNVVIVHVRIVDLIKKRRSSSHSWGRHERSYAQIIGSIMAGASQWHGMANGSPYLIRAI